MFRFLKGSQEGNISQCQKNLSKLRICKNHKGGTKCLEFWTEIEKKREEDKEEKRKKTVGMREVKLLEGGRRWGVGGEGWGGLGPGSTGEAAQTVVRGEGLEAWEGVRLLCLGSRERWCVSKVS